MFCRCPSSRKRSGACPMHSPLLTLRPLAAPAHGDTRQIPAYVVYAYILPLVRAVLGAGGGGGEGPEDPGACVRACVRLCGSGVAGCLGAMPARPMYSSPPAATPMAAVVDEHLQCGTHDIMTDSLSGPSAWPSIPPSRRGQAPGEEGAQGQPTQDAHGQMRACVVLGVGGWGQGWRRGG
jgi:hypothetical protein